MVTFGNGKMEINGDFDRSSFIAIERGKPCFETRLRKREL